MSMYLVFVTPDPLSPVVPQEIAVVETATNSAFALKLSMVDPVEAEIKPLV